MRHNLIRMLLCSVFVLTISWGVCIANDPENTTDQTPQPPNGPHIVWMNDSTVTVFYLCHDTVASQEFRVSDTLHFRGLCEDMALEYTIPRRPAVPSDPVLDDASRIFAVSDIHGEYERLVDILQAAGIVTAGLHWNWGDGHLVVVGDVFDRGDMVTECLWLLYRLEQEAVVQGGGVHLLLGNHETMVIRGDLRYVNEIYTEGICRETRIDYDDLYGPETELGRWLRTKPTAIMINGILFTHAGIPPRVLEASLSLSELNDSVRRYLDLPPAQMRFSDWPRYLFSGDGPLWYRGYFEERDNRYPRATQQDVAQTLARYNANAIVVGHSEVDHLHALYNGKVIAIDVPVDELETFEGLLWEKGELFRVTGDGSTMTLE